MSYTAIFFPILQKRPLDLYNPLPSHPWGPKVDYMILSNLLGIWTRHFDHHEVIQHCISQGGSLAISYEHKLTEAPLYIRASRGHGKHSILLCEDVSMIFTLPRIDFLQRYLTQK